MHFTFKEIAFDDHLLIKSFDLFLHPGECIIITGESGCGKTTLFNALTAHNDFLESAPSLTISAQKQKPLLCEDLTLQMQYEMIGSDATLFQHFDLMTHLNDYPVSLSGGERQRAASALTLSREADLYILDEPTASLNQDYSALYVSAFKNIMQTGRSLIIFTHDEYLLDPAFTHMHIAHQEIEIKHQGFHYDHSYKTKPLDLKQMPGYIIKMDHHGRWYEHLSHVLIPLLLIISLIFSGFNQLISTSTNKLLSQLTSRELVAYKPVETLKGKVDTYSMSGFEKPLSNKEIDSLKVKHVQNIKARYDNFEPLDGVYRDLLTHPYDINEKTKPFVLSQANTATTFSRMDISTYHYDLRDQGSIRYKNKKKGLYLSMATAKKMAQALHCQVKDLLGKSLTFSLGIPIYNTYGRSQGGVGGTIAYTYDLTVDYIKLTMPITGILKASSFGIYNLDRYVIYLPDNAFFSLVKKKARTQRRTLYIVGEDYSHVYFNHIAKNKRKQVMHTFHDRPYRPCAYSVYVDEIRAVPDVIKALQKKGFDILSEYSSHQEAALAVKNYQQAYRIATLALLLLCLLLSVVINYITRHKRYLHKCYLASLGIKHCQALFKKAYGKETLALLLSVFILTFIICLLISLQRHILFMPTLFTILGSCLIIILNAFLFPLYIRK